MKKRIFILLSSILCVLVTVALVTYTLVGIFSVKKVDPTPEQPPVVDTTVETEDITNDSHTLLMIVGDEYSGSILTAENYTGSLLTVGGNGKLVATTAGTENFSVQVQNMVYACKITVLEKGDGSEANPYNIIRPEDLIELVANANGEHKYYSQQCDLDLSAYESWVSIGTLTNPFIGSYNGNGYAIKNMNIVVTPQNIANYIDNAQTAGGTNGKMLTVGFFGFVGDANGNVGSEISNLSIHEAKIDTSAIETEEELAKTTLTQAYVGVLAGYTAHTTVVAGENSIITSSINSSIYADDTYSTRGGVSAFIGGAVRSDLSGYEVKSNITAKNPGTLSGTAGAYKYHGTTISGILGRNNSTNVSDFVVSLSVAARNYENTCISGGIGYIVKPTNAGEMTIENIVIKEMYVTLSTYSYTSNKTGIVAGAVIANYNPDCTVQNIEVQNIIVNGIGTAQVSGIIDTNRGEVKNVRVSGLMKGTVVAGIANTNEGKISWTNDFVGYAVNAEIKAQTKGAGVVIYNKGTIVGADDLTQIKAVIRWSVVRKDFEKIAGSAWLTGVAYSNSGSIKNLYTHTNIIDAINASGVVGLMDSGEIKNVDFNTTIRTLSGKVGSTVYSGKSNIVAGVVGVASKNANSKSIIDVRGNITVNNTKVINTAFNYGLNIYGSIVGKADSDITIASSMANYSVQATVFTNATSAQTQYIGYVVGKVASDASVSVEPSVKVEIAVISVAPGAAVGEMN